MNSYNKLAKLRDETIYQIKKALEARRIHQIYSKEKLEEGIDQHAVANFEDMQNAITLNELLENLVRIYEIE